MPQEVGDCGVIPICLAGCWGFHASLHTLVFNQNKILYILISFTDNFQMYMDFWELSSMWKQLIPGHFSPHTWPGNEASDCLWPEFYLVNQTKLKKFHELQVVQL